MSEYIVNIGFWLRVYDSLVVEADSDANAIEQAKADANVAMESAAYPEHIEIPKRRQGIIVFIDCITGDGRQAVIEDVPFTGDHVTCRPAEHRREKIDERNSAAGCLVGRS
jgi:hypothetical protein